MPQRDSFILRRDGSIDGVINWDYDAITSIEARPIDEQPLVLQGGVFSTIANRMHQPVGYNYWARNILVNRSKTQVVDLTHYVVGETATGHPYNGFINVRQCADIILRNCFVTPHKIYITIGAAERPVKMGSYDLHANDVVNLSLIGCRMNHILDTTRWGVIASNFCTNILLEDCILSRMDTHMGVSGGYTIRRCTLGYMGINAIGRGLLTVEGSTLYGESLIKFRPDYGSHWDGDVVVRNSRWIPAGGQKCQPYMFNVQNNGMHDFGHACAMPRNISIADLFIDDRNHPEDYKGPYLCTDPWQAPSLSEGLDLSIKPPFPYSPCRTISISDLKTASGAQPLLSPNSELGRHTAVDGPGAIV
ncbi:MAG: hypothetical protein LC725_08655 [Lentisphaerae bacterium]|nr:hypothetical protein [Lentisphaerota bacterium]